MRDLPKNAKRVFKGVLYEVWQWEQKLYDGSTTIFERLKRVDSAIIIATVGDKIIVLDEEQPAKPPFSSLPAGRADHNGDTALSAAKRELLEETGYATDDWHLWRSFDFASSIMSEAHVFIARDCQRIQAPNPGPGEKNALRLVSFDEFLLLTEDPKFRLREIREWLLRMQLHPEEKEAFQKLLLKGK